MFSGGEEDAEEDSFASFIALFTILCIGSFDGFPGGPTTFKPLPPPRPSVPPA
jgi:hypothetical protein